MANHRYFVEWSAPNYHNSGMTTVMAANQSDAVGKAKKKLGNRVKKQYLSKFRAWRDTSNMGRKKMRPTGLVPRQYSIYQR